MLGSAILKTLSFHGYSNILTTPRSLDLTVPESVAEFFSSAKPSIVINTAAKVGGIQANINQPFDYLHENLLIQNNIILNSLSSGVKRL